MSDQQDHRQGLTRRGFTKAAAWSAPVVAVAAAAPAAAASDTIGAISVSVTAVGGNFRFALTRVSGTVPTATEIWFGVSPVSGDFTIAKTGSPIGSLTSEVSNVSGSSVVWITLTADLDASSSPQTWSVDIALTPLSVSSIAWGVGGVTPNRTIAVELPSDGVTTR